MKRGWTQQHPLLTALLLVVVVAVPGYLRLEYAIGEAQDAAVAVAAETERAQLESCESRRDRVMVLRQLVELTAETGADVHFGKVPGFDELEPELRTYLLALEAQLNAGPPPDRDFVNQALELLVVPDCSRPQETP